MSTGGRENHGLTRSDGTVLGSAPRPLFEAPFLADLSFCSPFLGFRPATASAPGLGHKP